MKKIYNNNMISLYNCDCLELLKNLDDNSINLIYCDIPYNTNVVFKSYSDKLGSPSQAIDYYRPRFIEMKRVLKSSGAIFIHCSRRLDCYIGLLLDEIFGYENFRNRIYRKHSKERNFYKNFDSLVDIIFYYCKDGNNYIFNQKHSDSIKNIPIYAVGYNGKNYNKFNIHGKTIDLNKTGYHITLRENELKELLNKDKIVLINNLPYMESDLMPISNIWDEEEMLDKYNNTKESNEFDTPKPIDLVKRIIETCSNPGDVVADFFVGSGTTLFACQELNRKGIFCDINKDTCNYICKIINKNS